MPEINPSTAASLNTGKKEEVTIDPNQAARIRQEIGMKKTINKIKHTVAVLSGKGGVGKSTVTLNLAVAFAQRGYRVGLIDTDITGPSIPLMAGLLGRDAIIRDRKIIPSIAHGVHIISMDLLLKADTPVIWRGALKVSAIKQFLADVAWPELDILFLDLPPGTSDEPLSVAQIFTNIDGCVIVTTPQLVSVHDVVKSIGFASKVGMPVIGLIENMSGLICPHCGKEIKVFDKGGGKEAANKLGIVFLGEVPLEPEAVTDADQGKPSVLQNGKFQEAFTPIVDKVEKLIGMKDDK